MEQRSKVAIFIWIAWCLHVTGRRSASSLQCLIVYIESSLYFLEEIKAHEDGKVLLGAADKEGHNEATDRARAKNLEVQDNAKQRTRKATELVLCTRVMKLHAVTDMWSGVVFAETRIVFFLLCEKELARRTEPISRGLCVPTG